MLTPEREAELRAWTTSKQLGAGRELLSEIDRLRSTLATVEGERDEAARQAEQYRLSRAAWRKERDATKADAERLAEALRPFSTPILGKPFPPGSNGEIAREALRLYDERKKT